MSKRIIILLLIFCGLLAFGTTALCLASYDMLGDFDSMIKNNLLDMLN